MFVKSVVRKLPITGKKSKTVFARLQKNLISYKWVLSVLFSHVAYRVSQKFVPPIYKFVMQYYWTW